ncbi:hypothetical protein ACIRPX_33035 [Streptomyces sp. NPDC101225]|uniref:hypothetical protein n=1 Tax=Streptomyces sp. NPDC101225 TaxID=3366135 RepID=UPI0037FAF2A7
MTKLVVPLDLDGVTGRTGPMDRRAGALRLPGRSGRAGTPSPTASATTLRPEGAVERGPLPVVRDRGPYAKARPGAWETAQEVFAGAARPDPRPRRDPRLEDPPSGPLTCLDDPPGHRIPADMGQ